MKLIKFILCWNSYLFTIVSINLELCIYEHSLVLDHTVVDSHPVWQSESCWRLHIVWIVIMVDVLESGSVKFVDWSLVGGQDSYLVNFCRVETGRYQFIDFIVNEHLVCLACPRSDNFVRVNRNCAFCDDIGSWSFDVRLVFSRVDHVSI